MFRYLPLVLVGVLSALASFAAGISEDLPATVQIVFVACMALFFAALLAGTSSAPPAPGDET
jgi:hypothetical protein